MTCNARYVLFLNPDTEILEGTFSDLVEGHGRSADRRADRGAASHPHGSPRPNDPSTSPTLSAPLAQPWARRRVARRPRWLGERELDASVYDREVACDWTSGSFMLARREAIESAGYLDERYFMYSDETDFCRRIKTAGWEVRHLPYMTILHHEGQSGGEAGASRASVPGHASPTLASTSPPVHRAAYSGGGDSRAFAAFGLRRLG